MNTKTPQDRAALRTNFLNDHGWASAETTALPADASFRRYFRLQDGTGDDVRHALLMDAAPPTENIHAYITIAQHLVDLGLSAPRVEASDEALGLAIIEDFGESTYTRLLEGGEDPWPLYALAVDVLSHLHIQRNAASIDLPIYDAARLVDEVMLFTDWYLPAITGIATPGHVRDEFAAAWHDVINTLPPGQQTLVLRDYHVDNLMLLGEGREGAARGGILDFQDAVIGHPAYDLVSLLEDARRDVSPELTTTMRERYAKALPEAKGASFDAWYAVLGVQRHARVAGVFVRLCARDSKPGYLPHIPRVMGMLARSLSHPALSPVRTWFDKYLPDPLHALPDFDPQAVRAIAMTEG